MKGQQDRGCFKYLCDNSCQFSLRHILYLFVFLIFLVIINLFASTSRLKFVVDVSMKMKADVIEALHDIVDLNESESINGTFSIRSIRGDDYKSLDGDSPTITGLVLNDIDVHNKKINVTTSEDHQVQNLPWIFQAHPLDQPERKTSPKFDMKFPKPADRHVLTFTKSDNVMIGEQINSVSLVAKGSEADVKIFGNDIRSYDRRRQDSCDTCFEHNFNYIIDNPDVCKLKSSVDTIDILIVILTVHRNIKSRNALRETWLSPYGNNTGNIRYVFLLGEIDNHEQQERIRQENEEHHDIIKEDFVDSYMNLTYKTIMGFKWASTKCGHARFVLKTDDDMYVNTNNLLNVVRIHNSALQTALGGSCSSRARPIRNQKSKWYASFTSYPNTFYPGFCSGTGYVTSMVVAQKLYEISPSVPFFHLEDVYAALCIRKLGFSLKAIPGFNTGRPRLDPCFYKGPRLVTAHELSSFMLQLIWRRNCVRLQSRLAVPLLKKKTVIT